MVRMHSRLSLPFTIAIVLGTLAPACSAATVSGEAVYQQRCASCHDSGNPRVPTREALKKLSVTRIRTSMDFGTMGSRATTLRRDERDAVAAYLGAAGSNETTATPAKA